MAENKGEQNEFLQDPIAVRPPRKISRPKITLKMPPLSPQMAYSTPAGLVTIPVTPVTGLGTNYPTINVFQAYPNKAQEFMFKQFEGFKDFTMNTGKLGLSFGEKFAFWMYGKISQYSKSNLTHLLLLFTIILYCVGGGLVFYLVEGEARSEMLERHIAKDNETIRNATYKICGNPPQNCTEVLLALVNVKSHFYEQYHIKTNKEKWGLLNSIYFCGTIFTTIGYGNLFPATALGRIITIVYSLFGIPLFLILLADFGKLFTRVIKFFWAYVRRLYYTGSCRKVRKTAPVQEVVKGVQMVFDMTKIRKTSANNKNMEPSYPCPTSPTETPALSTYTIDDEFNLPISVAVTILLLYMVSGALLFMRLEGWSFLESFYFVYISVSTIGFGDIVLSNKITTMMISLVYFVFGLSLTSMCINVITEKLTDSFRQATAKIGATMGVEINEDSNDVNIVPLQKNNDEYLTQ